jgi:hypothetical protein
MKIWMLLVLVLVLGTAVFLAVSNPSSQDYESFLQSQIVAALERMDAQPSARERAIFRDVIRAHGDQVVHTFVLPATLRTNYGLWSVFQTRLFGVDVVVYGVGGHFIPKDEPDTLTRKVGAMVMTPGK